MSVKERRRLSLIEQVQAKQITLANAAELMGVSYRQAKRLWSAYRARGDAALVHGLRGRASNRATDKATQDQAVKLFVERYSDFGPLQASEYLASEHGVHIKRQTLTRCLKAAGLWQRRRRNPKPRRRRERRPCFGELVQMDGSPHAWFEGRAPRCVLMELVDDATSYTDAQFFEAETTEAAMVMLRRWALRHGLPQALYPDRHSIYRVNTDEADEIEARTGKRPPTQFGRAMDELGVRVICAGSAQAKGRVERTHRTMQDRLIKALRIAGISDIAAANAFLDETFLPQFNERFTVAAAGEVNVHVAATAAQLDAALCVREERTAGRDQCVSFEGKVLQLAPPRGVGTLSQKKVQVRRRLDGTLEVRWKQQAVEHKALPERPKAPTPSLAERLAKHQPPYKPPKGHPWRDPVCAARPRGKGRSAPAQACRPEPPLRDPYPAAG